MDFTEPLLLREVIHSLKKAIESRIILCFKSPNIDETPTQRYSFKINGDLVQKNGLDLGEM
jgi:hypothetical protein